jgi:hypothetical protein
MAGAWQESVTLHGNNLSIHVNAFRDMKIYYRDHEELYGMDRPEIGHQIDRAWIQHRDRAFFQCVEKREMPASNAYEAAKTQCCWKTFLPKHRKVNSSQQML